MRSADLHYECLNPAWVCVFVKIWENEKVMVQKMGVRLTGHHPLVQGQVLFARHWFSCLQDRWSARDIVVCHSTSWVIFSIFSERHVRFDTEQYSSRWPDLPKWKCPPSYRTHPSPGSKDKWCGDIIIVIWNTCELCEGMTQRSGGNEWPFPFSSFSWSWSLSPHALQDDERKLVLFHS